MAHPHRPILADFYAARALSVAGPNYLRSSSCPPRLTSTELEKSPRRLARRRSVVPEPPRIKVRNPARAVFAHAKSCKLGSIRIAYLQVPPTRPFLNLMRITGPCIEHLNRYGHGTQYLRQRNPICDLGTSNRTFQANERSRIPPALVQRQKKCNGLCFRERLHDYKEISKSPCLTCVAFSDQCGGTTDTVPAAILVWRDRRRSFDRCLRA